MSRKLDDLCVPFSLYLQC